MAQSDVCELSGPIRLLRGQRVLAMTVTTSQTGAIAGGSTNAIGSITQPIAAWRLTLTSTGGSATVTALQAGIG